MAIQGFGEANLKDIQSFQQNYNIDLPKDYIDFLLHYNGADIQPDDNNLIHISSINVDIQVDVLFGVNVSNPELGVELWLNDYADEMPLGSIIIGDSYEHGFLVLFTAGEDKGLYYWDHTYNLPDSNDEANTYFIADTFTDFINQLL